MSQENVETVRALYGAWNGPYGWETAVAFISDDFEWVNPPYAVEPGTKYGHAGGGGRRQPGGRFSYRHPRTAGGARAGDRVLCFTTFTARTDPDGVPFTQDQPHLWGLRNGKVVRFEWFHDRREALAAVGPSE